MKISRVTVNTRPKSQDYTFNDSEKVTNRIGPCCECYYHLFSFHERFRDV
jgi:hypothetical protein